MALAPALTGDVGTRDALLEVAYLRAWFHKLAFVQRKVTRVFKENPVIVTALSKSGRRRNRHTRGSSGKLA